MDHKKKAEIQAKISQTISWVTNELKSRGVNREMSVAELELKDKYTLDLTLDLIKKSKDLYYDDTRRIIKKRKKYPIADLRSFEEYIMNWEKGLVVSEELYEQYEGIENDINNVIKNQPQVRVIPKDKKTDVLFPKNINEDEVEKEENELDPTVKDELKGIWGDIADAPPNIRIEELKNNNIEPTEEYIQEFTVTEKDKEKKGRRGKPVKKVNDHLDIDFLLNFTEE